MGFVLGVWYGARLEAARSAAVKTAPEPMLEPLYRSPEWMKQRLDVIQSETRGKQDIDFPRSYGAPGDSIPISKAMGLDG